MQQGLHHRVLRADQHAVPRPFKSFAVRSDEPAHAMLARSPWACLHLVDTDFLDADALQRLAASGYARVQIEAFSDIDYATTTPDEWARLVPGVVDLPGSIAAALQPSGVLGDDPFAYRASVEARIDYLACRGAGFHNDVSNHWSRCLFWILVLEASDLEFVMPHAGLRLALAPGDLLVFDQTMAHGLCRPRDHGQALEASFSSAPQDRQIFLTGELLLSDEQWAALGSPWLPVQQHEGALDLMVAEFDERSGAIKRLHTLRDSMKRSTCHVG